MRISLIAAVAKNSIIGRGTELPWRLSTDLKRFKALTMGHHLAMGRKTFDSIGKPLAGRHMLVISRGRPQLPAGVAIANSLEEAIVAADAAGDEELFVAGGGEIYRLALPYADRLHLTHVQAEVEGDVAFPEIEPELWSLAQEAQTPAGPQDDYNTLYSVYDRIVPEIPASSR